MNTGTCCQLKSPKVNPLDEFLVAVNEVHPSDVLRILDCFRQRGGVAMKEESATPKAQDGNSDDGLRVDLARAYVEELLERNRKRVKAAKTL